MKYPTKEEILAARVKYSSEELEYLESWKNTYWRRARKHKKTEARIYALAWLLQVMASFRKQNIEVSYRPDLPSACYDQTDRTIHLNNGSIISALHELAHAFYGPSELMACAWSVQLFRKFFPKAYTRHLKWRGHMLVSDDR